MELTILRKQNPFGETQLPQIGLPAWQAVKFPGKSAEFAQRVFEDSEARILFIDPAKYGLGLGATGEFVLRELPSGRVKIGRSKKGLGVVKSLFVKNWARRCSECQR